VQDSETGYKIMLATSPVFVENEYGNPLEKTLRYKYGSGYELWRVVYDGLAIEYETYLNRITLIKITSKRFSTSKNISIENTTTDVIEAYGTPLRIRNIDDNVQLYVYNEFIKEINVPDQYTSIQFKFRNNKLFEIYFLIINEV
jgi:hypothetical protein